MADNFTRTINGREIEFKAPSDAQLLILGRLFKLDGKLQEQVEAARNNQTQGQDTKLSIVGTVGKLSQILDIIDSMVAHVADRDWLEGKIIDGTLDMSALMEVFKAEEETDPNANRATKRAAKKVTAKKTPARKSTRASED